MTVFLDALLGINQAFCVFSTACVFEPQGVGAGGGGGGGGVKAAEHTRSIASDVFGVSASLR
jgi:hypothetical protein